MVNNEIIKLIFIWKAQKKMTLDINPWHFNSLFLFHFSGSRQLLASYPSLMLFFLLVSHDISLSWFSSHMSVLSPHFSSWSPLPQPPFEMIVPRILYFGLIYSFHSFILSNSAVISHMGLLSTWNVVSLNWDVLLSVKSTFQRHINKTL